MREIVSGNPNSIITVLDEPSHGGACHDYRVSRANVGKYGDPIVNPDEVITPSFAHIYFQNGPVKENGVNGCHQEDLLHIVIDRLKSFQAGDYACRENALALTKCEEALMWLESRTKNRVSRGVEGKNKL